MAGSGSALCRICRGSSGAEVERTAKEEEMLVGPVGRIGASEALLRVLCRPVASLGQPPADGPFPETDPKAAASRALEVPT